MTNGANITKKCSCILMLSFFFNNFCFLIPSICHAQSTGDSMDEVLTLKQAIEIALKSQPQIEAQQGVILADLAKTGQVRGNYYPHVTLGSAYAKISPVSNETSATTSLAGLPPGGNIPTGISSRAESYGQYSAVGYVNQLIFDFGKTTSQIKAQNLTADSADYDLQNVRVDVIYKVKEAYYSLLNAERTRDTAAEAVDQFKKHLEYAQNLFETGLKPKFDVTKAEVDLSNAEVYLIKAQNEVSFYRMSLNNAMGMPEILPYKVEDDFSPDQDELTYEKALDMAFHQRPDLSSLYKLKESAEESFKAAQRSHYPTISGTGSYTYVGNDFPLDHGWTAGVNIVFPLFTGFVTSYQTAEAKAQLAVVAANERSLKQKITLDMEQGFLALKESAQRIRSTETGIKQAKENLELAMERYTSGLAVAVEISDAIISYANARIANSSAYYDHKIAQAQIIKAIGGE